MKSDKNSRHVRPPKARTATMAAVSTSRSPSASPSSTSASSSSTSASSSSSSRPLSQPPNPLHARPKSKAQSVFLRPPRAYAEYSARSSPKGQKTYRATPGLPSFQVRHSPTSNKTTLFPPQRSGPPSPFHGPPINNRLSLSDLTMPGSPLLSEDSSDSSDASDSSSEAESSPTPSLQPASGSKYTPAAVSNNSPMTTPDSLISTPQESERESIKTFLRLRSSAGSTLGMENLDRSYIHMDDNTQITMTPPESARTKRPTRYRFTQVFDQTATQARIFKETCLPLLASVLQQDNFSSLLFAYGVSNSGKTHSIIGNSRPNEAGILPRALAAIFKSIKASAHEADHSTQYRPVRFQDVERVNPSGSEVPNDELGILKSLASRNKALVSIANTLQVDLDEIRAEHLTDSDVITLSEGMDYTVWISCAEVYTEKIYDLLADSSVSLAPTLASRRPALHLMTDPSTGHKYVQGLQEIRAKDLEEALLIVQTGLRQRQVSSTLVNRLSSRSHSIFTIKVLKTPRFGTCGSNDATKVEASVSRLSVVDLAGSERMKNTKSSGQRLREAGNINTSLMVLGQCMEVLRGNQSKKSKPELVPYGQSKLTQLFQSSLEGRSDSQVALIVNVNSFETDFDETLQALRFSSVAMDVSTPRSLSSKGKGVAVTSPSGASDSRNIAAPTSISDFHAPQSDQNDLIQQLHNQINDLHEKLMASESRGEDLEESIRADYTEEIIPRLESLLQRRSINMEESVVAKENVTETQQKAIQELSELISLQSAQNLTLMQGLDQLEIKRAADLEQLVALQSDKGTLEIHLAEREQEVKRLAKAENRLVELSQQLADAQSGKERLQDQLYQQSQQLTVARSENERLVAELALYAEREAHRVEIHHLENTLKDALKDTLKGSLKDTLNDALCHTLEITLKDAAREVIESETQSKKRVAELEEKLFASEQHARRLGSELEAISNRARPGPRRMKEVEETLERVTLENKAWRAWYSGAPMSMLPLVSSAPGHVSQCGLSEAESRPTTMQDDIRPSDILNSPSFKDQGCSLEIVRVEAIALDSGESLNDAGTQSNTDAVDAMEAQAANIPNDVHQPSCAREVADDSTMAKTCVPASASEGRVMHFSETEAELQEKSAYEPLDPFENKSMKDKSVNDHNDDNEQGPLNHTRLDSSASERPSNLNDSHILVSNDQVDDSVPIFDAEESWANEENFGYSDHDTEPDHFDLDQQQEEANPSKPPRDHVCDDDAAPLVHDDAAPFVHDDLAHDDGTPLVHKSTNEFIIISDSSDDNGHDKEEPKGRNIKSRAVKSRSQRRSLPVPVIELPFTVPRRKSTGGVHTQGQYSSSSEEFEPIRKSRIQRRSLRIPESDEDYEEKPVKRRRTARNDLDSGRQRSLSGDLPLKNEETSLYKIDDHVGTPLAELSPVRNLYPRLETLSPPSRFGWDSDPDHSAYGTAEQSPEKDQEVSQDLDPEQEQVLVSAAADLQFAVEASGAGTGAGVAEQEREEEQTQAEDKAELPVVKKRKRLRAKAAVFEEEMVERIGVPPPSPPRARRGKKQMFGHR